jgi:hypothetical protein
MEFKLMGKSNRLMIVFIILSLLSACASSPETGGGAGAENGSGTPAMVDGVTVEQKEGHFYAVINGFYPDACTYISSVEQVVEGNTISLTLLTDRPTGVMCAAMLTLYTVDILLTIGGLVPREYSVVVNEGPSTTFTLE